ncbi:glycerophosphodiester phosphodiesterase [Thalassobaculum litoreum]|uniref:Glycerophosphoryl diester phosphodiesterase n=1 Tax=Thalassobaculum litoreum DSM 18839 TaxID=1123362 RepID=A0A8G2F3Y5_9PROT|nr:glycerophosphodiester phosphodiesterase [Thalassobaculum litoreum]SDG02099.1 glycerophosphoryl diester phosphodiesterase [Thalassobaculum litoreum DSM 18839]
MRRSLTLLTVLAGLSAGPALATDIHGHRGARGLLPENTLPAFREAIALGVDILELDTGMTADGVVVVLHDPALSPDLARIGGTWIDAPKLIRGMTHADLHAVDVGRARPGGKIAERFPDQTPVDGTPVPTLAEVLALAAVEGPDDLRFNIETKLSPLAPGETADPDTFARAVVAVIRAAGVETRAIVQSFDWRTLAVVRHIAPEIRTSYLTAERNWLNNVQAGRPDASPWLGGLDIDDFGGSVPRAIASLHGDIWSPYFRDLTPEALKQAHDLGLEVHVWTVNDATQMKELAEMGVDGIITDYPNVAVEVVRHKN